MSPELNQKLVEKYPSLFIQTNVERSNMRYGVCTGDGWFNIIDEACAKLSTYPVEFRQVKEKFGALRMYLTYKDRDMTIEQQAEISAIVDHAAKLSANTCDSCGQPGRIRPVNRGWLAARCDEHA